MIIKLLLLCYNLQPLTVHLHQWEFYYWKLILHSDPVFSTCMLRYWKFARNILHCYHLKLQLIFKRTDWYCLFYYLKFLDSHWGFWKQRILSLKQSRSWEIPLFLQFLPKIKARQCLFSQNTRIWKRTGVWLFTFQILVYTLCFSFFHEKSWLCSCLFQVSNDCVLNIVQIPCLHHLWCSCIVITTAPFYGWRNRALKGIVDQGLFTIAGECYKMTLHSGNK